VANILPFARTSHPDPIRTDLHQQGPVGGLFLATVVRFWDRRGPECRRCPSGFCTLRAVESGPVAYCVKTALSPRELTLEEARVMSHQSIEALLG
jgi:hypothetical protein